MGVREMERFLEQWEMGVKDVHRRLILAPTPRERERWHAVWRWPKAGQRQRQRRRRRWNVTLIPLADGPLPSSREVLQP